MKRFGGGGGGGGGPEIGSRDLKYIKITPDSQCHINGELHDIHRVISILLSRMLLTTSAFAYFSKKAGRHQELS